MAKFSALNASDLRTNERNAGRLDRCSKNGVIAIVTVEADDGSWFELDADSIQHARILADNQVDKMNARGCSCWLFNRNTGKLSRKAFYCIFAE